MAGLQPYIVLLGIACVTNALCAGVILSRERSRPDSRVLGLVHVGAAWWGVCEIAWNLAGTRQTALAWMRASAPGWVFVGPLVLHALSVISPAPTRLRRLAAALYALAGLFLVLAWTGPSMMADAVRTSWGWGYRVGDAYPAFYALTMLSVGAGYTLLGPILGAASPEADRRQRPFLVAGMLVPLAIGSTTDALLPLLGVQVPRLGTLSFAVLGLLTVSTVLRFGYSLMLPSSFSEQILATLSDGMALLHPSGRIRSANQGLARMCGRTLAELEQLEIGQILDCPPVASGREPLEREAQLLAASGERIPVAVTSRGVDDRRGNPLGLVVSLRDLRELHSLRTRLVTSDRLAAVGQLAAGIAHEINNPLAFVRANLSHLEGCWKKLRGPLREGGEIPDAGLRELLVEADELIVESLEGVDRAAEIVRSVRGFSHAGSSAREPTDVNQLLEQVLVMASPRLRGHVVVERSFAELPAVFCASQQIKQVALNLLVNAAQAVGERGRIQLETRRDGDFVEISVEDDGPGIPEEIRGRIFDPFFTTKPVGEGTGLGLGIALEIAKGHGGSIDLYSTPGGGARFCLRLPIDARGA